MPQTEEQTNALPSTQHSALRLRDALASDKEAILEFCRQTWAWGDYIAEVWDEWFSDTRGGLRVGEVAGKVVGANKLTMLNADEGWMEGMRLHPDYRGRGLAHEFMADMVELAAMKGATVVRLATASSNAPIQHAATRLGLHKVAAFTPYTAEGLSLAELDATQEQFSDALRRRLGQFYILEPADMEAVWLHIESSPLRAAARLYAAGWSWAELTQDKLLRHLRDRQVVARLANFAGTNRRPYLPALSDAGYVKGKSKVVPAATAICALAVISGVDEDSGLEVGYVDYANPPDGNDEDEITALALVLRLSAASLTPTRVSLMLPNDATLELAFERAGFHRDMQEGQAMWVYERRLKVESV